MRVAQISLEFSSAQLSLEFVLEYDTDDLSICLLFCCLSISL